MSLERAFGADIAGYVTFQRRKLEYHHSCTILFQLRCWYKLTAITTRNGVISNNDICLAFIDMKHSFMKEFLASFDSFLND